MSSSAFPAVTSSQVEIVIPATSWQRDLVPSVLRLRSFLASSFPYPAQLTIACDSSGRTWATATRLAATFGDVAAIRTDAPGRTAALRAAWARSQCQVLAYADPGLTVDPAVLVALVQPLLAGEADIAVGTRLAPGARPLHRPRRELTSCGYSLLVQAGLGTGLADVQCGCKAITRARALELLPLTNDADWFFDTKLLLLAERAGLRIHEVAVNATSRPWLRPSAIRIRSWLANRIYRGNAA
jgi:hypothetical protein